MFSNDAASHSTASDSQTETPYGELARRDELCERLRWLVGLRWIALICVSLSIPFAQLSGIISISWPLYGIAALMLAFNFGFRHLHSMPIERTLRALSTEALMQIGIDIIGLGLLLLFSGGLTNPFVFFFTHHVVISAILLDRRKAYGVAGLTTVVVTLLWLGEQSTWFDSFQLSASVVTPLPRTSLAHLGLVFVLGTTLLFSAYVVASLMERLRGQSKDVRRLNADLAERVESLAQAEKKLSAEHQRAQAILECMEEGVVVVDLTGKIIRSNSAAKQSILESLQETLDRAEIHVEEQNEKDSEDAEPKKQIEPCPLIGAPCLHDLTNDNGILSSEGLEYLGADPSPKRPAQRYILPDEPKLVEIEANGHVFENTISAVKTKDNETLGLVLVSRDVTERRSLQRQVLHGEKLHAVGNLAAGVAHELNTPLGTILGYAQLLLEDKTASAEEKELRVIEEQARRCRKIVKGMLDYARKSGTEATAHQLEDLVATATELTAHTFEMKGISFAVEQPEQPLPQVMASANEIEQVLVNLLTNAADAVEESLKSNADPTRKGSVCVRLTYDVNRKQAVVQVEDNGPGISEMLRDQIFEPFFTTKVGGKGTGLGLSIARRIIEGHGGQIVLKKPSPTSTGTTFEIRLPVTTSSPKTTQPKQHTAELMDNR